MDIALGGLIILLLLLPGISFRKGYFSQEFSNQYTIKDFFQLFINTLFPSLIFYLLILPIIFLFGYFYDFKVLLGLLSSEESLITYSINKIDYFKVEIISFQIIINIIAFYIGCTLRGLIVSKSYDAKFKFFRYKNIWHYLLSAKFIFFERSQIELNNNKVEDVDVTFVDALLTIGDQSFIYTGILVDYELSSDGSLDLLYLKEAQRKEIKSNSKSTKSKYKDINGNIIILKYENIVNLNLSFIEIREIDNNKVEFSLIS